MKKPTMLYASPFWPIESGISNYSSMLVQGLCEYFDVTLLVDGYKVKDSDIDKKFPILQYDGGHDYGMYDVILCNLGNQAAYHGYIYELMLHTPCWAIMHDGSLYYLTTGFYDKRQTLFTKIYEIGGPQALCDVKDEMVAHTKKDTMENPLIAMRHPLHQEVLSAARGIFVHSHYLREELLRSNEAWPIARIDIVQEIPSVPSKKQYLRTKYKLSDRDIIIAAFGFIDKTKQNLLSCKAIERYNETHEQKIHYIMCGKGYEGDPFLGNYIHKTDFISNEDFFSAMADADIVLNLRYPYKGETSATLVQAMGLGLPCVVTDIGWFSEVPNACVKKVPWDITSEGLCDVIEDMLAQDLTKMKNAARTYVMEKCSKETVAKVIAQTIGTQVQL